MSVQDITRERIRLTETLIRPHVRRTPLLHLQGTEFGLGPMDVVLKLELCQHSGSFKARGAFANILMREVPKAGIVAASGGNHGAAVAFAAMKLGKPATIFVPTVASPAKVERIRGYGARLILSGDSYADAFAKSEDWIREHGGMSIHAYDQPETLLGQGTIGLEFQEQWPALDTLLVAVGGGGLIGGIAAWYAEEIRIVGVEPEKAPTLTTALRAGRPVDSPAGGIAADSLAPRRVGELMFPIAKRHVDRVVLVSDSDIVAAQKQLWNVARVVAEPGGAAALAALTSGRYKPKKNERVGVLVCGGNTEAGAFSRGQEHRSEDARAAVSVLTQ
jgi:threonine dehydratase